MKNGAARDALARVSAAEAACARANAEHATAIAAVNEVAKNPAALEEYAREIYPADWAIIDGDDTDSAYKALNKRVPEFVRLRHIGNDPMIQGMIHGAPVSHLSYEVHQMTLRRLRAKQLAIKKRRKNAKK